MKRIAFAATSALALLASAHAAAAADLSGLWATRSSGGIVEIAACGEAVCGRLVRSPFLLLDPTLRDCRNRDRALRDRPLKGLTILSGFRGGPGGWSGGQVYDPDKGRTYSGAMELVDANRLKVTACLAGGKCRTQVWTRLED